MNNNDKDNLDQFNPRSDGDIFLSYSNSSKSYRVYNKKTLHIKKSIHVIF